jgi:hypothetical protein
VDADRRSRRAELLDALRLAMVPVGVALVLGVLLLPRRAVPDEVPLPIPDGAALARSISVDEGLAALVRREPLPGAVRALGSAIRAYHTLEGSENGAELGRARRAVDATLAEVRPAGEPVRPGEAHQGRPGDPDQSRPGDELLLRLRAVQLEGFLDALRRFESTGVQSDELAALGGAFVPAMTSAGWCEGHTLVPREPALRAMFKQMWNAFLGLENTPGFELSLDEERALYAVYLAAPHPSPASRTAIDAARRGAHDAKACEAVREAERVATEAWRLDRIARFASIDPTYPASFARGVASYRRGDYRAASSAFRTWLTDHPEGPLSLRAHAFLRASDAASGG